MLTFIVDSDLHFTDKISTRKQNSILKMKSIMLNNDIETPHALICIGDLTEEGLDGKKFLCYKYGGNQNQLGAFIEQYEKPAEELGLKVYLCDGNHEHYVPKPYWYKGVVNYIAKKHSGLMYSFCYLKVNALVDKKDTIVKDTIVKDTIVKDTIVKDTIVKDDNQLQLRFICLSKYPTDAALIYLKSLLNDKEFTNHPTVIFFHYNLVGIYSDWWSSTQKDKFEGVIKGHNIVAILNGHRHDSIQSNWRGYKVIMAGGTKIALCSFDGKEINVEYF